MNSWPRSEEPTVLEAGLGMQQKQVMVWEHEGPEDRNSEVLCSASTSSAFRTSVLPMSFFLAQFFFCLGKIKTLLLFFFFPPMFQTLFLMPVFQRTLKCFIFIPSQNKDILQWLEILLWSRMIIFHLAFWMLTKASRRIHFRLQISPGYSEIAASVVDLLAQTYVKHFLCILSQALWVLQ